MLLDQRTDVQKIFKVFIHKLHPFTFLLLSSKSGHSLEVSAVKELLKHPEDITALCHRTEPNPANTIPILLLSEAEDVLL